MLSLRDEAGRLVANWLRGSSASLLFTPARRFFKDCLSWEPCCSNYRSDALISVWARCSTSKRQRSASTLSLSSLATISSWILYGLSLNCLRTSSPSRFTSATCRPNYNWLLASAAYLLFRPLAVHALRKGSPGQASPQERAISFNPQDQQPQPAEDNWVDLGPEAEKAKEEQKYT